MRREDRARLSETDPELFTVIAAEEERQRQGIELIPSENYSYPEVRAALGSILAAKYAEGYPGKRYYGGQRHMDAIEELARARACALFGAEHANVQPLSDVGMNQAVYFALLAPGDTVLALDLSHGGHVTHGAPASHIAKVFRFVGYRIQPERGGAIDFDALLALAQKHRPKLIVCGYSAYSRNFDYPAFRRVADVVGAYAMADISHTAGLVAAGVLPNPFAAGFDIVTSVTHKTLRGPRGGLILCRKELASRIDASVFPGLQTAANMNTIAGAAVAFKKAESPEFHAYCEQMLANAQALAAALREAGVSLVCDGTDNHMLMIDTVQSFGLDGGRAEAELDGIGITTNKQMIPDDPRPPLHPSGIRLGTPACTTRGMGEQEMRQLAGWLVAALRQPGARDRLRPAVAEFSARFPVPGL